MVVMLVGIGFAGLLTAAIAERFIVAEVEHEVAEGVGQVTSIEHDHFEELHEDQAPFSRIEAALRSWGVDPSGSWAPWPGATWPS